MAQFGDESDMMLMCELVDEEDPVFQASVKEIVELREEKVRFQDHGSESCVDGMDADGDSKICVDATDTNITLAYVAPEDHESKYAGVRVDTCAVTGERGVLLNRPKVLATGTRAGGLAWSQDASCPSASAAVGGCKAIAYGAAAASQSSCELETCPAEGLGGSRGVQGPHVDLLPGSFANELGSPAGRGELPLQGGSSSGGLGEIMCAVLSRMTTATPRDRNGEVMLVPVEEEEMTQPSTPILLQPVLHLYPEKTLRTIDPVKMKGSG